MFVELLSVLEVAGHALLKLIPITMRSASSSPR